MLALSIQQPYAQLVILGEKKAEYRSRQTHMRGRFYVYVPRRLAHDMRAWFKAKLPMPSTVEVQVIIGTVEIIGCRPDTRKGRTGFAWQLANPVAFDVPLWPDNPEKAQPSFWQPALPAGY